MPFLKDLASGAPTLGCGLLLLLAFGMLATDTAAQESSFVSAGNAACVEGSFEVLDPGRSTTIHSSEHFAVRWNASDEVTLSASEIQFGLNVLEDLWRVYVEQIEFPEPYCDSATKYKVSVNVSNQGWATGGGTGDRDPAMWLHFNAFKDAGALAHEFTHTLQFATRGLRDSRYVGWMWESHAEWMRHQFPAFRDQVNCAELLVNFPHLYYGSTRNRYCNWQFWEFTKNRYGYEAVNDIWRHAKKPGESGQDQEDPFSVLQRNMDWSIGEFNDEFGYWAMHNATWDYTNPDGSDQGAVYRERFGSYADRSGNRRLRVTQLEALDRAERRFVVPEAWAPQRWGYNLVRLYPDASGRDTTVNVVFRGVVQEEPYDGRFGLYANVPHPAARPDSDWRWGLVARDAQGDARYSELQRGPDGDVSFDVRGDDRELWLVIVGTPSTMHKIFWDQMYFTIYRYPWMVEIDGALPEGFEADAPSPTAQGGPHANGGGWVAAGASVASSAFVGPHAMVLAGTVKDSARVEDHAVVMSGIVSDKAVVGGLTLLTGGTVVKDSARLGTVFLGPGAFERGQSYGGSVQVYGDAEVRGQGLSLTKGVFYGFIDGNTSKNILFGSHLTEAPGGVTIPGPYVWRNEPVVSKEPAADLPNNFELKQNYPNPFNPSSTIAYSLAEAVPVRLTVFDALGREIKTLVEALQPAGEHEVRFDANGLPAGTYFYRLEAGGRSQTRSLVLVK